MSISEREYLPPMGAMIDVKVTGFGCEGATGTLGGYITITGGDHSGRHALTCNHVTFQRELDSGHPG